MKTGESEYVATYQDLLLFDGQIDINNFDSIQALIMECDFIINKNYESTLKNQSCEKNFSVIKKLNSSQIGQIQAWDIYGAWVYVFFRKQRVPIDEYFALSDNSTAPTTLVLFPNLMDSVSVALPEAYFILFD
jgi:hypothetical protein